MPTYGSPLPHIRRSPPPIVWPENFSFFPRKKENDKKEINPPFSRLTCRRAASSASLPLSFQRARRRRRRDWTVDRKGRKRKDIGDLQ